MKSTYLQFIDANERIVRQIEWLQMERSVISTTCPSEENCTLHEYISDLKQRATDKRRYDYRSLIVSIYGNFERFIEGIIQAYIGDLCKLITEPKNLPDGLLNHHFELSISILGKLNHSIYNDIDKKNFLKNMYLCCEDSKDYKLNKRAFSQHSANFRVETVFECINRISVKNIGQRLWGEKSFILCLKTKYGESWEQFKAQTESEIKSHIDDLAERRNAISHGSDENLLSLEIILDYINSINIFSRSLFNILEKSLLPYIVSEHGQLIGNGFTIHVNKIIEIGTIEQKIKIGNTIVSKSITNGEFLDYGKVTEIRCNGSSVTEIINIPCQNVSIALDFKVKSNQEFYLLKNGITL